MSTDVRTPVQGGSRRGPGQAAGPAAQQVTDSRRPARPTRQPRPGRPASPQRPASPVRPPGPGRPGRPARTGGPARPAGADRQLPVVGADLTGSRATPPARHPARMSFVLLVLGLLGGGLICLLVVNTTLAAASIGITRLQQDNSAKVQLIQELQQQVASDRSSAVIAREAARLGMRARQQPFIDLRTATIVGHQ
jgi:hypothetical protein